MSDRGASISDAAFREALREYHSAAVEMATQLISADRWRDAEARVLALYAERDEALAYANELCRSAFQIASRQGRDTNWSGFANRLMEALAQQHRVMYPGVESLQGQAEPYRVPANAERQGEVYEVIGDQAYDPIVSLPRTYAPGDRVRVMKVEEGT